MAERGQNAPSEHGTTGASTSLPDDVKNGACGCGEPSGPHTIGLHAETVSAFERAVTESEKCGFCEGGVAPYEVGRFQWERNGHLLACPYCEGTGRVL